jgi:hypothetical protein
MTVERAAVHMLGGGENKDPDGEMAGAQTARFDGPCDGEPRMRQAAAAAGTDVVGELVEHGPAVDEKDLEGAGLPPEEVAQAFWDGVGFYAARGVDAADVGASRERCRAGSERSCASQASTPSAYRPLFL